MSGLDNFLCLKKSRLHGFDGKFIEQHLDIRAIAENEKVMIKYIRDVFSLLVFCFVSTVTILSKVITVLFDRDMNKGRVF